MQESFDTINLEYVEVRKTSFFTKLIAIGLAIAFTLIPMYEFLGQFKYIPYCTYGIVSNCGCIAPY